MRGAPKVLRVHHCAFAHDLGGAAHDQFEKILGLPICHTEAADGFVERMISAGNSYVQTLEATGPGVVEKFVLKRGAALHHIAFEVDDLDEYLTDLKGKEVRLIDEVSRPGGMGTRIAFIHPSEFGGLLVELVEDPQKDSS